MTRPDVEAAWRQLDATQCAPIAPRVAMPPADLETRDTSPWLEPVRFFGEPIRYSSGPLPANSQHRLACALEDATRDLTPVSAAAPNSAAVRNGRSSVPGSGEGSSRADERPAFCRHR